MSGRWVGGGPNNMSGRQFGHDEQIRGGLGSRGGGGARQGAGIQAFQVASAPVTVPGFTFAKGQAYQLDESSHVLETGGFEATYLEENVANAIIYWKQAEETAVTGKLGDPEALCLLQILARKLGSAGDEAERRAILQAEFVRFPQLKNFSAVPGPVQDRLNEEKARAMREQPNKYVDLQFEEPAGTKWHFCVTSQGGLKQMPLEKKDYPFRIEYWFELTFLPGELSSVGVELDEGTEERLMAKVTCEKRSKIRSFIPNVHGAHDVCVCISVGKLDGVGDWEPFLFKAHRNASDPAITALAIYNDPKPPAQGEKHREHLFALHTWPKAPVVRQQPDADELLGGMMNLGSAKERWQFSSPEEEGPLALYTKTGDTEGYTRLATFAITEFKKILWFEDPRFDPVWVLVCRYELDPDGQGSIYITHQATGAARRPSQAALAGKRWLYVEVEYFPTRVDTQPKLVSTFIRAYPELIVTGLALDQSRSLCSQLPRPKISTAITKWGGQGEVYVVSNCAFKRGGELISLEACGYSVLTSLFIGAESQSVIPYTSVDQLPRIFLCPCPWAMYCVFWFMINHLLDRQFGSNSIITIIITASVVLGLKATDIYKGAHGLGHGLLIMYLFGSMNSGKTEIAALVAAIQAGARMIAGTLLTQSAPLHTPSSPRPRPMPLRYTWIRRTRCRSNQRGWVPAERRGRSRRRPRLRSTRSP